MRTSTVDGYEVKLIGDLSQGGGSLLTLRVSKDGEPVTDLQPYLGALGHLVVLRAGDLAYLHAHPETSEAQGPDVGFHATAPSRGRYHLYLDFQHDGVVRTATFTLSTDDARPASPEPRPQEEQHEHSH